MPGRLDKSQYGRLRGSDSARERELESHPQAATGGVLRRQFAAVEADRPLGDGQPQAGATLILGTRAVDAHEDRYDGGSSSRRCRKSAISSMT